MTAAEAPYNVCQRAGDQEILLNEPQPLPAGSGVVGVKHARQGLGHQPLGHRAHEVAVAEYLKIKKIGSGGGPKPERVDILTAVAGHRPVEWYADQRGRLSLYHLQSSSAYLEGAVQLDRNPLVRARHLPR